jgi:hypothetical protein
MRTIHFLFLLTLGILCSACDNQDDDKNAGSTSETSSDSGYGDCYYENEIAKKCSDSVLFSILGKAHFKQFIRLDRNESSMNCEVNGSIQLVPFGDTSYCAPNSYNLSYFIIKNGQRIFEFELIAGKDMQFEVVSTIVADQLRGYRNMLDGDFKIDYSQASKIAKANGINLNETTLELVKHEANSKGKSDFHWEAELKHDENSIVLLWIDVMTGKTTQETLKVYNI